MVVVYGFTIRETVLKKVLGRCRVHVWGRCRVDVESMWGRCRVNVGSKGRCGVMRDRCICGDIFNEMRRRRENNKIEGKC